VASGNGSDSNGDFGAAGRAPATAGAGASGWATGDAAAAGAAGAGGQEGTRIGSVPAPRGSAPDAISGTGKDGPGKPVGRPVDSSGTRRKSVVFEEDDELDVPDFLK